MSDNDFLFDGRLLSDMGMMVCYFDDANKEWSGGEITFTTAKPPDSDRQRFYTYSFDTPLSCTFSICKDLCNISEQEDMELTREEYGKIMRWLVRTDGYHWLQFNVPEFEDVYFNVYFNAAPHFLQGRLVGLDLTMTADAPYGYSKEYKYTYDSTDGKLEITNYSDKPGIIYPHCEITPKADGDILLYTGIKNDYVTTTVKNAVTNQVITLDGDTDLVDGCEPSTFNYVFPILKNSFSDTKTFIQAGISSVAFTMDVTFRMVRWVVTP